MYRGIFVILQGKEEMQLFSIFFLLTIGKSSPFFFILAVNLGLIEIEAEGNYGWAYRMPTWYRVSGLPAYVYGLVLNKRPLTGYHLQMFIFPIVIFHTHFFMGVEWSLAGELNAIAMYFLCMSLWDFLWFIFNPHYGIRNFKPGEIWWHAQSKWFLGLPVDYYVAWVVSAAFMYGAGSLKGYMELFYGHLIMQMMLIIMTLLSIQFIAPLYHGWYWSMRRPGCDERHKIVPQEWLEKAMSRQCHCWRCEQLQGLITEIKDQVQEATVVAVDKTGTTRVLTVVTPDHRKYKIDWAETPGSS